MARFTLRLIAEGKDHSGPLDLQVDGNVLNQGDRFTIVKDHPKCEVQYQVERVENRIHVPKDPPEVLELITEVYALRVRGGYKAIKP
jgi:hypothetical protein